MIFVRGIFKILKINVKYKYVLINKLTVVLYSNRAMYVIYDIIFSSKEKIKPALFLGETIIYNTVLEEWMCQTADTAVKGSHL